MLLKCELSKHNCGVMQSQKEGVTVELKVGQIEHLFPQLLQRTNYIYKKINSDNHGLQRYF